MLSHNYTAPGLQVQAAVSTKVRIMWKVQYKPDNASQEWVILNSFDNMPSALLTAGQAATEYFMVVVVDPEGSVIWSN
jgi:hypothetical protein